MVLYDWLKSVCQGVPVVLDYVHESHVEWVGEHDGRIYNVTSTFMYGPDFRFEAVETIDSIMERASSVYVTLVQKSTGQRWQGEILGPDTGVVVDYTNVAFLGARRR